MLTRVLAGLGGLALAAWSLAGEPPSLAPHVLLAPADFVRIRERVGAEP